MSKSKGIRIKKEIRLIKWYSIHKYHVQIQIFGLFYKTIATYRDINDAVKLISDIQRNSF